MSTTIVRWINRRLKCKNILYLVLVCISLHFLLYRLRNKEEDEVYADFESVYLATNLSRHEPTEVESKQACVHPKFDDTEQFYHQASPIICSKDPDWITIENGTVSINSHTAEKYGDVSCEIRYIIRIDDFHTTLSMPITLNYLTKLVLEHDFFTCRCITKVDIWKRRYKTYTYDNVHAGITHNEEVNRRVSNIGSGLGLNVLMIGHDSVSQIDFKMSLKESYKFFTEKLNGIQLNGYNIVGDGTPQALIPILTGKTELELPNVLQTHSPKTYVDVYPMVWKDFRERGYVTAFGEDTPNLNTFTYRMNGFKKQPTDHYPRPFYLESLKYYSKFPKLCLGSRKRNEIFLDWYKQFFVKYKNKPKFAFGFYSELSHNKLDLFHLADQDLLSTLKYLNHEGHLNNTILILMSDHGQRFSKNRGTILGKQKERRPFVGFAFPNWFKAKYPKIIKSMKINSNRLTTPFDLYFTFRDILDYNASSLNNLRNRGMSLFKEIPEARSCEHAHIDTHWCACLKWIPIRSDTENVVKAAASLVKHINVLTEPYRNLCAKLHVKSITKSLLLLPKRNMVKFKGSKDIDGRIPNLSGSSRLAEVTYQIMYQTTPGNGLYEATITLDTATNKFNILAEDISRINKYGSAPKCLENKTQELRKYCWCV